MFKNKFMFFYLLAWLNLHKQICMSRTHRRHLPFSVPLFLDSISHHWLFPFHSSFSVRLSPLTSYYIPHDGPQATYKDYINMLPPTEHPEVFGQHPNADIASQIAESRTLFDTLLSMQPQVTSPTTAGARPSREDKVRRGWKGRDD